MRRFAFGAAVVLAASILNLATVLFLLSGVSSAGPGAASSAGDADGDGQITVADAVYWIQYLFQGDDPPVACAGGSLLEGSTENLTVRLGTDQTLVPAAGGEAVCFTLEEEEDDTYQEFTPVILEAPGNLGTSRVRQLRGRVGDSDESELRLGGLDVRRGTVGRGPWRSAFTSTDILALGHATGSRSVEPRRCASVEYSSRM